LGFSTEGAEPKLRRQIVSEFIKYVGMDVHKETIAVAVAPLGAGEVRYFGEIANAAQSIDKLVKQIRKDGADLKFCYEAGPCGYGIHRQLESSRFRCKKWR
jgi:hypothetical protein